jgi:hypothetical protein
MGSTALINQLFQEAIALSEALEHEAEAVAGVLDGLDEWARSVEEAVAGEGERLHAALDAGRRMLEDRAGELARHADAVAAACGELATATVACGRVAAAVASDCEDDGESVRAAIRAVAGRLHQDAESLDGGFWRAISACEVLDGTLVEQLDAAATRLSDFADGVEGLVVVTVRAAQDYALKVQQVEAGTRLRVEDFRKGSEEALRYGGHSLFSASAILVATHNEAMQGFDAGEETAAPRAGIARRMEDQAERRAASALLCSQEALATLRGAVEPACSAPGGAGDRGAAALAGEVSAAASLLAEAAEAVPAGASLRSDG